MKLRSLLVGLFAGIYFLPAQEIPLSPNVVYGKLENGLTYYIEENNRPENRVELRLAINVGSIVEDDDQLGLAHFMEHMNFNGTKNFPGNTLVDNLQSIGVKFGQHLNAYTGFDETVYILPIPLEKKENLDIGMRILEDWAFNAILTDEEINKERGVVLEELRLGTGADRRMLDNYLPKVLNNSHYADRLPIGKKEIIENFDPEVIRRFHRDWYRPDLMAVVVVGDIDAKEIEKRIKTQFGKYKNPENPRQRLQYDVPNHKETYVAIESDPEASFSNIELYYKDAGKPKAVKTIQDYRESLIKSLFSTMLNNRLNEYTTHANPPYTYAGAYYGETWAKTKNAFQSFAMTPEGGQLNALNILLLENERIQRHGFNQSELDRAKNELLSRIERMYNDRDKTESNRKVMIYVYHYLSDSPATGIEWQFEKYNEILPGIKIEEVNALIKNYIRDENRVVVITGPQKESIKQPTEKEILAAFDAVEKLQIDAYNDDVKIEKLVKTLPEKGKIVKTERDDALSTVTWTLSNGAKITFKKTDFKNDEILFRASRLGGNSILSDQEHKQTKWAYGALSQAGLMGYSQTDLTKYLSGKQVNVSPFISLSEVGLSGSSTPKDLETLFELIYANFTGINKDPEAYQSFVNKQSAFYDNLASQPRIFFTLEHEKFISGTNPRVDNLIPLKEDWDKTDYALAHQIFTNKLKNAGDFHFMFVGNVDEAKLKELSEKFIATLPSTGKAEKYVDNGYRNVSGTHNKSYKKGIESQSFVDLRYYGEAEYSEKDDLAMQALASVIGIKLVEKLREDESGTYTSSVNGGLSNVPYGSYFFRVFFPCGPENVDRLLKVTQDEIARVVKQGPDANDLAKFKESEINDYKEKSKINRTWLNVISGENVKSGAKQRYIKYLERLDALTASDVQKAAQKYLTKDYVLGILYPENQK
ncbi:MAG: insulinase family protein [Flavobacteriaceae bacterium]|nr:insulinase family protein [Flavobacteriaceae bacterium]